MTDEKHNKKIVKAAAVQAAPVYMDLAGGIKKACKLIEEAADKGCDLIAFPECWLPGYPFFTWLNVAADSLKYVVPYHENSLEAGSEAFVSLASCAAKNKIYVSMGASERDHGTLYISQFLFNPMGELISGRRKLKATHMERTIFGDGKGSDLQVVDTELGKIGQLCCWEHLQPLTKYAMYSMHEQIHISAWPSFSLYPEAFGLGPQLNNAAAQMYAAEGQCFVLAPCGVISTDMIGLLVENQAQEKLISAGGGYAQIFGPDGRPLCEPLASDAEGLLIADLPMDMITIAKSFGDPVGHYARPDVTRLLLCRDAQPCVEQMEAEHQLDKHIDEQAERYSEPKQPEQTHSDN